MHLKLQERCYEQLIRFDTLYVDSTYQSVGFEKISQDDEFKFNPKFFLKVLKMEV